MAEKNPLVKPYLKWAGGKRQLLPEIRKNVEGLIAVLREHDRKNSREYYDELRGLDRDPAGLAGCTGL